MKSHPLLIRKILYKIEKEANQEQKGKASAIGLYRASQVGGCGRAIQYQALGYKAESLTPETFMILKDGHMHHDSLRKLMGQVGTLSHVEQSISKRYKHNGVVFVLTGTLDGIWNGRPFDIKSMSTFMFKKVNQKNFIEHYPQYIGQIMVYLDILGMPEAFFLLKDKNSGELKVIDVTYSEKILTAYLDKIAEVHIGIKKKKLITRPYDRSSFYCKTCPFRLHCWKMPMEGKHW